MGFDLYGKAPIVPKENVKKINSIHKQIKLVQSDPDMDTADKHEKVWAYEQCHLVFILEIMYGGGALYGCMSLIYVMIS